MGNVIWHISMSLDGFIAGPNDEMDWVFENTDIISNEANQVINSIGAILGGRRWWDIASKNYNGLDGIYGGAWSGPVHVITHHPPENNKILQLVYTDKPLQDAVKDALKAANGKNLLILGANVAQQCLEQNLLNEIVIHIVPVLLGNGVRLIKEYSISKRNLELTNTIRTGQTIEVYYHILY